ncbi:ABC transporter ATP-binding protein [Brevibacillus fluminis]|uniref:ABC transporter ATP-binding protein n=1 Tax=Brevibacillus fluminis TaxID=511487 RepID=UPI003F8C2CAF
MSQHMVELRNIVKRFDQNTVVSNLNLDIQSGEFITLLGPSGCGKTTTLRMIAGFEHPTSGEIILDGTHVENLPAYERNVNTVFQNYALFPHLNCFENVAFGLRVKKTSKADIQSRVMQALKLVQLESFANRRPDQLSGGQKQRIAIARALVNNPKVLLLDEPLGALDQKLRKQMQVELKHLQKQLGVTFIFVTHDQEEALTMSDRIAVMNKGNLDQVGTPSEIYDHPATTFVAEFIGETNLLAGKVLTLSQGQLTLACDGLQLVAHTDKPDVAVGNEINLAIRPERVALSKEKVDGHINISARMRERIYSGGFTKTIMALPDGKEFIAQEKTDQLLPLVEGDEVNISWNPAQAVVLKR